ncbi:MAG: hypothetical protein MI674_03195 [Cytophagales bacterium]|nr:hypothetical protein [Cytophagales bacterium]
MRIIKKKISIFATIKELTLQQNIRHILKSYLPIALVATLTVVGCVKKGTNDQLPSDPQEKPTEPKNGADVNAENNNLRPCTRQQQMAT